jgi:hypothetical protein
MPGRRNGARPEGLTPAYVLIAKFVAMCGELGTDFAI